MHALQKRIIQKLLYSKELKYSELKGANLSSDKFWFHLKTLIKEGFVEKHNEKYFLTELGKLQAHDFDNITLKDIVKPLTMVTVVACHNAKYLITKRNKQPFHGYFGFPGGKVEFSEKLEEAGKRILKSETSIEIDTLSLVGIQHEMNINKKGEIIRDAFIYLMYGKTTTLPKKISSKDGEPFFVTESEYKNLTPRFKDVDFFFENLNKKDLFFEEFITDQEP